MTNPLCDPYLVLAKVYSGGKYLKQALADTPMEPLNRARTVRICYGVIEKDIALSRIIEYNAQKTPPLAIRVILKIALYMKEYMDKHDYVVNDCAVELTKKLGKGGAAGFVNAFLRSYKIPPLPQRENERAALECGSPLWLYEKLKRSFKGDAVKILSAPSLGVCVRFERGEEKYLKKPHEETPFEHTFIFKNFTRDEGFESGDYTFQSVGSVAICNAVKPCDSFLDACAAPGGKSVLISKKCKSVTACEIHPHRVELINAYTRRMGVRNVTAMQADSREFISEFENAFDGVLCDAPCSGTGVINENPDIRLFRKESDIKELSALQLEILSNCSRYVKEGGTLYYSTCSVLPEENDSVVYAFLKDHPEYGLEIPSSPLANVRTKYGLNFLPHISMGAGFFLTAFTKKIK